MSENMFAMLNAAVPFILMIAIFYFLLWRPQKKEQKQRRRMLESLKKGDKVVTVGGILGTLSKVGPEKVTIEIAEGVEVDFAKTAVNGFQDPVKQEMIENGN